MIIDLCCGLGRFESDEEIISIDIDPKTKPTICADIRYLPLKPGLKPSHVHASPPCTYFSTARQRKYGLDMKGIAESLEIVSACFHAFDYLEAEHWTLENPLGYLSRLLNETKVSYQVYDYKHKKTCFYSDSKSHKRAIIPQDVRQMLLTLGGKSK